MGTIAANTTTGDTPAWLRSGSAANPAAPAGKSGANPSTAGGSAGEPAVSVVLSDQAKARLKQLQAGLPMTQDQSASLDAMVQKRTEAFAATLSKAFAALQIPLDDAISLQVDKSGQITTDSPYKKAIAKYFEANPEAAKEFKAIASLNALRATQKALELYNEEQKAARNKDEQGAAWDRYATRSMAIQKLSGSFSLKQGKLSSAAMDYVIASDPRSDRAAQAEAVKAQANRAVPPAAAGKAAADPGAEIMRKYGNLPLAETWAAQARADNIGLLQSGFGDIDKWVGFAREMKAGQEVYLTPGRVPSDDESFQQAVNLQIAGQVISLEDSGRTADAQALRAAFNGGTINLRKSTEVADLNLNYQTVHFADAGGGGTTGSWDMRPTGAVKAALDSGNALVFGGGDRGAFYLTW
ncbi:MAG: hypothetical protein J0H01_01160 [Rhizobiales bacterium]|nr:hypothetical protein [Hyphomicrobiales bacterium]